MLHQTVERQTAQPIHRVEPSAVREPLILIHTSAKFVTFSTYIPTERQYLAYIFSERDPLSQNRSVVDESFALSINVFNVALIVPGVLLSYKHSLSHGLLKGVR